MAQASILFPPAVEAILQRRGVTSGVKGDDRNRSKAVTRAIEFLDRLSTIVDPAPKLGSTYPFALEALFNAWSLGPSDVQTLDIYFRSIPGITALARERNVDLDDLYRRLAELDFAERLALVDRAQQHHARTQE